MFKTVNRKLIFYVMIAVIIVNIIIVISIYGVFKNILVENYIEKVIIFSEHEIKNIDNNMNYVGSAISTIVDNLAIDKMHHSDDYDPHLINNINAYRPFYPVFDAYFIYLSEAVVYTNGMLYSDLGNIKDFFRSLNFGGLNYTWAIRDTSMDSHLLYIQKLSDKEDSSYAVFSVDPEFVFTKFVSDNPYINYRNILIVFPDHTYYSPIAGDPPDIGKISGAIKTDGKEYNEVKFFSNRSSTTVEFTLDYAMSKAYVVCSNAYVSKFLHRLLLLIISILLFICIICFWVISRFSREIRTQLEGIHSKMKNYIS